MVSVWSDKRKALSVLSLQSELARSFLVQINSPSIIWMGSFDSGLAGLNQDF